MASSISSAVYDRICRLLVDYQSAEDEVAIVQRAVGEAAPDATWTAKVVDVVRASRGHPELRIGSSVRGAIDCAAVATSLGALRGVTATDPNRDVVLRYHWMETLRCSPDCTIVREPVEGDRVGFMRVPAPHPRDFVIENSYAWD